MSSVSVPVAMKSSCTLTVTLWRLGIVVQCVSITSELRAHGGKENIYGCQRPSSISLALWTLTPAGLSVAGQRFGIAGEVLTGPEDAAAFCRYLVVPVSFYDVPFDDYRALGFPGAGRNGKSTSTTPSSGRSSAATAPPRSRAR